MNKPREIRIKESDKTVDLIDWLTGEAERQKRSVPNLVFVLLCGCMTKTQVGMK